MNEPVGILITYVERTEGPLHKTHNWRCVVRVGEARHEFWCLTREAAVETANRELMRMKVSIKKPEHERVGW